jgi:hypothetical protein
VQSAFPIVVFGAVALSVVMSVVFLLSRGSMYDQIGGGGLMGEFEPDGEASVLTGDSPAGRAERELEIRQMLTARSERLVRSGQAPLDVDAELERLMRSEAGGAGGGHDAALTAEVRQLVLARNERRRRQDLEPLDVEAEVQRTLAELDP